MATTLGQTTEMRYETHKSPLSWTARYNSANETLMWYTNVYWFFTKSSAAVKHGASCFL